MEPPAHRLRDPETGKLLPGTTGQTSKKWRYRYSLNLSPAAYLKHLRVMELLHDLNVPWEISASTAVEFMVDVLRAYQQNKRLDIKNWKPETRLRRKKYLRRRKSKATGQGKLISQIADAEAGGVNYIREKIKQVEHDYAIVKSERIEQWKLLKRAGDEHRRKVRGESGEK